MAQRGVIVRRLEAIENLGSMDMLCTDKTGTLTDWRDDAARGTGCRWRRVAERVCELAYLNAALETGIENPLDEALVGGRQGAAA